MLAILAMEALLALRALELQVKDMLAELVLLVAVEAVVLAEIRQMAPEVTVFNLQLLELRLIMAVVAEVMRLQVGQLLIPEVSEGAEMEPAPL